jgi:hypothetical protein
MRYADTRRAMMPLARADQVIEEGCCLLHCMSPVMVDAVEKVTALELWN